MAHSLRTLTPGRVVGIVLAGMVGTAIVLYGLVVMNRVSHAPEAEDVGPLVDFAVPPPPPPPPPQRRETPPRPPRRTQTPALAPLPDLGSNLSGIAVDLPEFQAGGVDTVSESLLGDLDNVALTEDAVDQPPAFRTRIIPDYPERARQREIEGSVTVSVLVGVDGRIRTMQVLEAVPPGVFEESVLAALRQSTFEPAQYRGDPVETWVNIPFPFRLN